MLPDHKEICIQGHHKILLKFFLLHVREKWTQRSLERIRNKRIADDSEKLVELERQFEKEEFPVAIFFLVSNENFIKKRKTANPSTLGMYYGGINQWPRLQQSSKAGREEQVKWKKTPLQSRRVCKKKDLISNHIPQSFYHSFRAKYTITSNEAQFFTTLYFYVV